TAPGTRRLVVSASLTKKYFGDSDPIGRRIVLSWNDEGPDEIVGIVGDIRAASLETDPRPTTYLPPARFPYPYTSVILKTFDDSMALAPASGRAVRDLDPDAPVADIRPMAEVVSISTAQRRVTMVLLVAFAVLALVLAGVGIYGVVSYSVTQRTQEIGI